MRHEVERKHQSHSLFPLASLLSSRLQLDSQEKSAPSGAFLGKPGIWIFDSYYKGCVNFGAAKEGSTRPAPPILPHFTCTSRTHMPIGSCISSAMHASRARFVKGLARFGLLREVRMLRRPLSCFPPILVVPTGKRYLSH
jgi:hypothetical protein